MKVEPGKDGEGSAEGRLAMDIELDISPNVRWEEFVSPVVLFPQGGGLGATYLIVAALAFRHCRDGSSHSLMCLRRESYSRRLGWRRALLSTE